MIAIYLRKRAIIITISESPPSTLHSKVINSVECCAGLNILQVNKADGESDKQTSPYTQMLVPSKLFAACNARLQYSMCERTKRAASSCV